MMSIRAFILSLMLLGALQAPYVSAHVGGHGPVSEQVAHLIATDIVQQFVNHDPGLDFGKLAKSWKNVSSKDIRTFEKTDAYYIIAVNNAVEKKTLYVLMSIEGEVFDANFSGEFPGLKK